MNSSRMQALQQLQKANGVACVALMPGANLRYFTGLDKHLSERPVLAFLPAEGPPAFLLPELEVPSARPHLPDDALLFAYRDEEGHEHAFHQAAEALALAGRPIGIEYLTMRVLEMRRLEQAFIGSPLLAVEPWLPPLRMSKDETELAHMRRAVQIAQEAMQRLLDEKTIRPGRTELEIAADLKVALLRAGNQGDAFTPIVVAGPNSAQPHAGPSGRPLAEGDLVIIDWGAVYKGYRSDITRTFVLGQPTPEIESIHRAVLTANRAARAAARPDRTAQDVDRAARQAITQAGYGDYFIHRTGHGLGLEIHEPPYIVEGNLDILQPGMTFTVEPGVYVPGLGGVRIEDDVSITETGAETLTTLPRELIIL